MRRLWFYKLFDAVLFLRLMSVGEIATWIFLDWKARALSKRGVVYGTSVYRISRWQTTKRLLCGKLQWWTLPRDGYIFVRNFSVGLKIFCYGFGDGGGEGGGERSEQCKGRESECVPTVHNSNLSGLGAALAQPNGVTIRIVHKGGSDIWKQRDWPGLAFTSNVKKYASGRWFIHRWESCFDAFVDPIFF